MTDSQGSPAMRVQDRRSQVSLIRRQEQLVCRLRRNPVLVAGLRPVVVRPGRLRAA